jgi:hypothetical protein
MKIKIMRKLRVDLNNDEFNLVIHALQSHAEIGSDKWPGEDHKAAELRDALLNAEVSERSFNHHR